MENCKTLNYIWKKIFFCRDEMLPENVLFDKDTSNMDNTIRVEFPQIGRTQLSELYTNMANKEYRPFYEKGRIQPGMETLPFGYRNGVYSAEQQQQHSLVKLIKF